MSAESSILELLITPRYRYKGVPISVFFLPAFGSYKSQTIRNSVSLLAKRNHIHKSDNLWRITPVGRKYQKKEQLKTFQSPFKKNDSKNLLIMFDIPETKRLERNWFRLHLKNFGYVMIQKSVWVGPSPLPKEFREYATHIGLKETIKQFKLFRSYKQN